MMATITHKRPGIHTIAFRDDLARRESVGKMASLPALALLHDLRNPIAAVYANAEMLIQDNLSPQQSRRLASGIYRASAHADRLLKNLVNVWRGEGESRRLWNLSRVIHDVYEAIEAAAHSQMVSVTIDIPDFIEVAIQRTRMESVFLNLLTNALEAMPSGGRLSLRGIAEADGAVVEIDDSGPGIPKLLRESLFQPFATAKQGGLGLGLMLSRQAVLEQQGELWLASKTGPGARFCVRLSALLD